MRHIDNPDAIAGAVLDGRAVFDDLDIDAYHAGPAVSKSGLDLIAKSPAHFHAAYLDPARPPRVVDTAAQLHGSMAHCAFLEPAAFDQRYIVGPDVNRNTKEWKAFAESLTSDQTPIKPSQRETALRQAQSMRRLPEVREAMSRGVAERSAYWRDEKTGELCRCRPDWVHEVGVRDGVPQGVILLDVKTFASASVGRFQRQAAQMRYHVQDSWYSDGYALAAQVEVFAFVFIVVETDYPYVSSAMMLDDQSRQLGREEYRRNLDRYAECKKANSWPGYSDAVQVIGLPGWSFYAD